MIGMQTFCIALDIRLTFNFIYCDFIVLHLMILFSFHFAHLTNFFVKFKMSLSLSLSFSQVLDISHYRTFTHSHSFK